jgi:uncharacterized repeat protein (TIGR01451 family)
MDPRATTRTRLSVLPVFIALLLNVFMVGPLAPAPDAALALAGTSFDATDGNLAVDGGETDWCTDTGSVVRKNDLPTGQNDDSYAEGAKEDDLNPPVATGSIPRNKVDLDRIYVDSETGVGGDLFVYVGWVRNDDNGTGTISFELNQSGVLLSNGVNHQRTAGDLLVTFDFGGGDFESLEINTWTGTAWGPEVNLVTTGLGEGSVNQADVADCIAGGTIDDLKFGEFSFNLTDLIGDQCRSFASLFAKSRASNPIESKLKELVKPAGVDFSTCGQITILKQDELGQALGGATFGVTPDPFIGSGSLAITDNAAPDHNPAAGTIHFGNVEPGTYTVCETAAPAGYIIDTTCQQLTVAQNGSAQFGPFTNGLGDLLWAKVDAQTEQALGGASFSVSGIAGAGTGFSATVVDNGTNDADGDAGKLRLNNLKLGTYRITETVAPAGYDLPSPAFQDVVLGGQTASAQFAFTDAPQADASIAKDAVLSPIVAGDDASFAVTIHAGGTGASENVLLSDENTTGRAWSITGPDAGDCAETSVAAGETLSCDFGTIPNGGNRSITITMASDADDCADGIANTASVTSSNDHDTSNNEDSASIEVFCPNPGVVKVAAADPIVFGGDAVFTITVNAGGTGPAENVVLTDENDSGRDWTISGTDAGACADTSVADGETLTCTWATIPAGASRSITITMTTGEADCDLGLSNTASITADADVDRSNNEDGASIRVLCPDAGVLKTAEADPINAADPASFDIVVSASGTGSSENVVLSDLNDTGHPWTISGADASACADLTVAAGETLTCTWASIPTGQSRTVTVAMDSDPSDCANGIENTATITSDADTNAENNSSFDSIEVLCPDLELEKSGSEPVSAGDDVSFTLDVTNGGQGDAMNVVLTDNLPGDGLGTWIVDSVVPADAADCGIVADVLTCSVDMLEAGGSFSVTVSAATDSDACPSITNDASVVAANESANDQLPNTDAFTITVNCPDVSVVKEAVESPISAGEQGQFSLTVTNAGPGVATDVVVIDMPEAGTTWTVLDAGGFSCDSLIADSQQTLTCTMAEMGIGSAEILIGYTTSQADCPQVDNAVTVAAANERAADTENNADTASVIVECPGLNVAKRQVDAQGVPTTDPIDAGDTAYFEILVWNTGPGTASDVVVEDTLPLGVSWSIDAPDGVDCASSIGPDGQQSFSCLLGDLPVIAFEDATSIVVAGDTDRDDCGELVNVATVVGSNNDDDVPAGMATISVKCPTIELVKDNDAVGSVLPGTTVAYTLTLTVTDGPAEDVLVVDAMPDGLSEPTNISDGGSFDPSTRTITWDLGDLASGEYTLTYDAVVADDVAHGEELVNAAAATSPNSQCPDLETLADECDDTSTVTPRVPSLVIDKIADTEVITISGSGDALEATPSVVTWTLTYTLANGPVTNAVITDEVPVGFEFLDASDRGQLVDGAVTWTFPSLTESGSVTFRTTVDPETISRAAPTVNVAVIDSDETGPDDGQDSVTVTVEPPPLGGTPTPEPSLPNTATAVGPSGEPITVPVELLAIVFLGSLGAMALANARTRMGRR